MNAQHYRTAHWVRDGIFDELNSFADFEIKVNEVIEEKDRGDIFEIFIEGYLATQPIAQCVKHWVVGEIPLALREKYNLPNNATGIDGIYEKDDGSHVAYQVKYRQKSNLTFAEVAPFLGITEAFADRVIFTNASTLSHMAIVRTRWFNSEVFNALSSNSLSLIEAWLKEKSAPIVRATPDPDYQVPVLQDIRTTLLKHDRATVVMACGTGKTLVSLWAAEQANPKTVLVLVPSLTLLQQTLREWSEHTSWGSRFSYLCVCSDKTVDLRGDELNIVLNEVGFPVNTDPNIVRKFLQRDTGKIKIIFSTYQSSTIVGEGAKDLPPIDLAIFDEAHKTTGLEGGKFGYALSNKNICISKRLFLTATPRHYDIRRRNKEGEFRIRSMDDESVYGPRAHTLSFSSAANKGIICKYKVIVSLMNREIVNDFARKNGITIVDGDEIGARWVANLIALQRGVEEVGAKKIISFHSRVKLAQEFGKNEPRGIAYHLPDYDVRHVNGKQKSLERGEIIREFAKAPQSLLTNARCLTEGVDIPAVDMVAFIDPKQSRIDIAQAVGRAMRKPRGATTKTVGYVLVPLFSDSDSKENLEDAIKSEKFDAIADVLNALQEHDEDLVDIIREIKERKGEDKPFNAKRLDEKIQFIGPRIGFSQLAESIGIAIADHLGISWDEYFGRLKLFKAREGHCQVPRKNDTDGEPNRLGSWVSVQRVTKDSMPGERRHRLDDIGFDWDPYSTKWNENFTVLEGFKNREGHCLVPQNHIEGGFKLGYWVGTQRRGKDTMPTRQKQQLDEMGFVWDPEATDWEANFTLLEIFQAREGHCRVPQKHVEGGVKLGSWVSVQRVTKDSMPGERRHRLDDIGFDWDPIATVWNERFAALMAFKKREGHCHVPQKHVEGGFKLSDWIDRLRKTRGSMPIEQRDQLDAIGFDWDPYSTKWNEKFTALEGFKKREGHCSVPHKHVEGGLKLGIWVGGQRSTKDSMPVEKRKRLDDIGFVWDKLAAEWENNFIALKIFKEREGHYRVLASHVEGELKLGNWVSTQRTKKDTMPDEQRRRLDAIGFDWDPNSTKWNENFTVLEGFKKREGHCSVPKRHIEGGVKLGQWVLLQRLKKDSIPAERRRRLDDIGFDWDPYSTKWNENFTVLEGFKNREGHCLVPFAHIEGGIRLGLWVGTQRLRKEKGIMSAEQKQQLDAIGFVWRIKKIKKFF